MNNALTLFWFRRDLRLDDNTGFHHALNSGGPVQPIFIFDSDILGLLKDPSDARVNFIYDTVLELKVKLEELGSDLWVFHGAPLQVYETILRQHQVKTVICNHDYEPRAIERDARISQLCSQKGIEFKSYKDQVIFEKSEILNNAKKPFTVFTPYKKKWLAQFRERPPKSYSSSKYWASLNKLKPEKLLELSDLGFQKSSIPIPPRLISKSKLKAYAKTRDFPALDATTRLGIHLRFGTLSIRKLAVLADEVSDVFLSELIWREFFMQVLFHFPHNETKSFNRKFDNVAWRSSKSEFQRWCEGTTGYPLVDAGMRQLNQTGFMHNRVRMVAASFLTKHLLIHWYEGERYFAEKLLDYELAANNGNWQWAAGTGCDAAPYFRIFNPQAQTERFDPKLEYIKMWIPEVESPKYPDPMVEHQMARQRAIETFKKALT